LKILISIIERSGCSKTYFVCGKGYYKYILCSAEERKIQVWNDMMVSK